ncbi:MAG TPA: sigma-70 family RNA polymerase sigma factor [Polyangiaceae bacterium]|jgi:RNA polymerase sigma-32 factor
MTSFRTGDDITRYVTEAARAPLLTREQETELAERWRRDADRTAADTLVRAHFRNVVAFALKYRRYGIPVSELIAEGNFGVVCALGKFEPERGIRFATYAAYWVRAYILDHVIRSWSVVGAGSGPLRSRLFFKLRRERARVTTLLGEGEASEQVIAERIGVTLLKLRSMVVRLDCRDLSLEAPVFEDSAERFVDTLPAVEDQEQSLLEHQAAGSVQTAVALALAELDPRERYIAERRLMADSSEEASLAEIGRKLGVSRERARQLEARTKRKLRARIPALGDAIVDEWLDGVSAPAA